VRGLRVALLGVLVVVAQVSVMPHLRIAGVAPDLVLVFTIAVAYRLGPEAGALTGFGTGLGYDLFLETPLGLSALSAAVVGYSVGVFSAGLLRVPRGLAVTLGLVGGLAGGLIFVGVGTLAGSDSVQGLGGLRTVLISAGYDALVAPLVFALVGLVLRGERPPDPWMPGPMLRR